jgi:hypothetical protein
VKTRLQPWNALHGLRFGGFWRIIYSQLRSERPPTPIVASNNGDIGPLPPVGEIAVVPPTDNHPLAAIRLLNDAKAILHRTSMPWRLEVRNWGRDKADLMTATGAVAVIGCPPSRSGRQRRIVVDLRQAALQRSAVVSRRLYATGLLASNDTEPHAAVRLSTVAE